MEIIQICPAGCFSGWIACCCCFCFCFLLIILLPASVAGTQVGDRVVRRRITGKRSAGRTAAEIVASLADLQDLEEMGCLNAAQSEGLRVGILRGH